MGEIPKEVNNYQAIMEATLPKQLANEHWNWVVRWLEIVYKDAFIHSYKHGMEDKINDLKKE